MYLSSNHSIDFNGQSFQVQANYGIQKNRKDNWWFTQPSSVSLELKTVGLPDNLEVHVNELYSEVSMVSKYAKYNGVRQDSTDLKYGQLANGGIAIDNDNSFAVPFQVEGINANQTSFYMINGYGGSDTSRITESDLRDGSAQGGALKSVWTILITDSSTNKTYAQTVQDSIGLPYKQE